MYGRYSNPGIRAAQCFSPLCNWWMVFQRCCQPASRVDTRQLIIRMVSYSTILTDINKKIDLEASQLGIIDVEE